MASYSEGAWRHRRQRYSKLAVTGGGCLLFGITREPTIVSDSIEHFYFIGPTLSANGVAIAKYIEKQDTWHGLVRPMWWTAMRIVSRDGISALVDHDQVVLLNPWEPSGSYAGVSAIAPTERNTHPPDAIEPMRQPRGAGRPLVFFNDLYLMPTARACTIRQRVPSRCSNLARPVTQG